MEGLTLHTPTLGTWEVGPGKSVTVSKLSPQPEGFHWYIQVHQIIHMVWDAVLRNFVNPLETKG